MFYDLVESCLVNLCLAVKLFANQMLSFQGCCGLFSLFAKVETFYCDPWTRLYVERFEMLVISLIEDIWVSNYIQFFLKGVGN